MTRLFWKAWGLLVGASLLVKPLAAQSPARVLRPILDSWLTCIECEDGELDRVIRLSAGLPGIIDTLRTDLFQGPSGVRRNNLIAQLDSNYRRLVDLHNRDSLIPPPSLPRDQFIHYYLGDLVDIYQGRAALALGAIGGRRARAILDSAISLPPNTFSPHVLRRIRFGRDSIRS